MTRPGIRPVPASIAPVTLAPGAVIGGRYRLVALIAAIPPATGSGAPATPCYPAIWR